MRGASSSAPITPTATTTAATASSLQLITEIPPCNQPRTARRRSASRSLDTRTSVTSAPANDVSTTPARRTVSTVVLPPSRARRHTSAIAPVAPTNAAIGTSAGSNPSATATTAPSDAPADVPVTNGPASGLRSMPCRSAPAAASAPPTSAAPSTRGRRSSRMIVPLVPSAPRRADSTSPGAIATAPTRMPAAALSTSAATSSAKTVTVRAGRAGRDVLAARDLDEVVDVRTRPDGEDLRRVGRVDLVIHARSGRGRGRLRPDVVDALLDVARHGLPVAPDGAPEQDRRPRDVAGALRIDHQHEQPRARELFDRAVGELYAQDEVRPQGHDLFEVDLDAADLLELLRRGRLVREVVRADDARSGTEREEELRDRRADRDDALGTLRHGDRVVLEVDDRRRE